LKVLPNPPSELIELFYDAERFVLEFFDPISASASHVYYSALPFAPLSTQLHKMYAHERSGTIRVVYGIQHSWSACLRVISTASPVRSVAFSPDNTYVASGTEKEGVQLWKTSNGINFATLGGDDLSCSVTFSSDGLRVAVGETDGFVHMWEVETGSSLIIKQAHQQPVNNVSFAPDNSVLASASCDTTINLWDARTGCMLSCLSGHTGDVTCIAFSPDSQRLASASNDATIRVWDKTFRCLFVLTGHENAVLSVTFSPNGTHMASGSADKTVRLWNSSTGKCLTTKAFHSKGVLAVKYSSDGLSVISISEDLTVKSFHITKNKPITIWSFAQFFRRYMSNIPGWHRKVFTLVPPSIMGIKPTVDAIAFSTISVTPFALAAEDNIVVLHDLKPSCDPPFLGRESPSSALAISRNGAYLASGSPGKDILICDTSLRDRTWEKMAFIGIEIMAVASDGTRFVISTTGDLSLIDADGSLIAELRPSSLTTTWRVIFSPDSKLIAVASSWTSTIRLFNSRDGASILGPVSRLGLFFDAILTCVVFSPDSTLLACGDSKCTPEIRRVPSGERIARLQQTFEGEVTCVAFSPDMSYIVFGNSAGIVRCWNWRTDVVHTSSKRHDAGVTSAIFTPDSTRVVSGSSNGSLQVWILGADSINWRSSTSIAILSLSFHSSATGVELVCRDEKRAMEIWNFGEDEKSNQMIPRLSWRTAEECVVADQTLESNFFLRDDGWLFDGTRRVCWIPKMYRPSNNIFYMRGHRLIAVVGDCLLILDLSGSLTN
jgi:WD40 repeat protein